MLRPLATWLKSCVSRRPRRGALRRDRPDGAALSVESLEDRAVFADDLAVADVDDAANLTYTSASGNSLVGITAYATSPSGAKVSYSLTNNAGGQFSIDSAGRVRVAASVPIPHDAPASYTITIQAVAADLSISTDFTIDVLPNQAPSAPVDTDSRANTVSEGNWSNQSVGIDVVSSDVGGGPLWYYLIDDADGLFKINYTTGVISTTGKTRSGVVGETTYTIKIVAEDSARLRSEVSEFTIALVNSSPYPASDVDVAPNQVTEGAAAGTTVGVTMFTTDPGDGPVTYSIRNPDDIDLFAIDPQTGVVTVAEGAFFNIIACAEYDVVVIASDGELSYESKIEIEVLKGRPKTPVDGDAGDNVVMEGARAGALVGVWARSVGYHSTHITGYSLVDDAGGRFLINQAGSITLAPGFEYDYESSEIREFTVGVQATGSDGLKSDVAYFTITLGNRAPLWSQTPPSSVHVTTFAGEGAIVGPRFTAHDPLGGEVTYALLDDAGGRFTIDHQGVVRVNAGVVIDYFTGSTYQITVVATDGDKFSTPVTTTINVLPPTEGSISERPDPYHDGEQSVFVYGTAGKDVITVSPGKKGSPPGTVIILVGKTVGSELVLPPDGWINIFAMGGDDTVKVSSKITHNIYVDGGDGNDKITGGRGDDVLVGGAGNDVLNGQGGRDLLIGGLGKDKVYGAGTGSSSVREGNLLIGDATDFENDREALAALAAAWSANSPATLDDTVRSYLNDGSVLEDGQADALKGTSKGTDWFWSFELTSKGKRLDKLSSYKIATDGLK